jgi:hypothetical protein
MQKVTQKGSRKTERGKGAFSIIVLRLSIQKSFFFMTEFVCRFSGLKDKYIVPMQVKGGFHSVLC